MYHINTLFTLKLHHVVSQTSGKVWEKRFGCHHLVLSVQRIPTQALGTWSSPSRWNGYLHLDFWGWSHQWRYAFRPRQRSALSWGMVGSTVRAMSCGDVGRPREVEPPVCIPTLESWSHATSTHESYWVGCIQQSYASKDSTLGWECGTSALMGLKL